MSAYGTPDLTQLGSQITLNLDVDHNGSVDASSTYQTNDYATSQHEAGLIVKHDYTNLNTGYLVDPTYVGELAGEISSSASAIYSSGKPYAIIRLIVGDMCIYPGYYQTSNNIVGDLVYFQDSNYYQAFSYVTVIEEQLENYKSILRRVLHPAGTKHFGIMQINNAYQIRIDTEAAMNLIAKKDAIRDFVRVTHDLLTFVMGKGLDDDTTVTDLISHIDVVLGEFTDTATITDSSYRTVRPVFGDFVSLSEALAFTPGIQLTNLVYTSQLISFNTDKYLSNSIQLSNAGGVWNNPYTEVAPTYYWTPGYLENERAITT